MDVPRIHYEMGTRRVGVSTPVANAGANQLNITPQIVTLNGSGSYDPAGETLTYQWTEISGPAVTLSAPTAAVTTFTALTGQTYIFRLTVTNTDKISASATTEVSVVAPSPVVINMFQATPTQITAGQSSTLSWSIQNATSITISGVTGTLSPSSGTATVSPTATTTYTLTATGAGGTATAAVTVAVTAVPVVPNPQIVMYTASPLTVTTGGSSTLNWSTNNAASVTISNITGAQPLNGSVSTGALQSTTSFVLTAMGTNGNSVSASITISVQPATIPTIVVFTASPQTINNGQSSSLCWQVNGATTINISGGVGSSLPANSCQTVSPTTTTTYTLTATNAQGTSQASVTVNVGSTQILQFSASPEFSPIQGGPVVLTWQTSNATSIQIVGGDTPTIGSNLPVNGSITVNPNDNATYTLIAYGPGGATVTAVLTVYVR